MGRKILLTAALAALLTLCVTGTTWAWFAQETGGSGSVSIGRVEFSLAVDDVPAGPGTLAPGAYTLTFTAEGSTWGSFCLKLTGEETLTYAAPVLHPGESLTVFLRLGQDTALDVIPDWTVGAGEPLSDGDTICLGWTEPEPPEEEPAEEPAEEPTGELPEEPVEDPLEDPAGEPVEEPEKEPEEEPVE